MIKEEDEYLGVCQILKAYTGLTIEDIYDTKTYCSITMAQASTVIDSKDKQTT